MLAVENVGTDVNGGAMGASFPACCAMHWLASTKAIPNNVVADILRILITLSPECSSKYFNLKILMLMRVRT
jgi:hypothetical protein